MSDGHAATTDVSGRWRWFVALGVALFALGIVAWVDAIAVTVASAAVIGATVVAGGVLQILHSLIVGRWRGMALSLCSGILYAASRSAGHERARARRGSTDAAVDDDNCHWRHSESGAVFRSGGIQTRALLLGGIASIVIGALIYLTLPWPGLWVLGTLIAIELFVQGSGWFYVGLALRAG